MIKTAGKKDIDNMVELFINYINNSFFVEIGKPFLRVFLRTMVNSSYTLNFIYVVDSETVGFISGTYDYPAFLKEVFFRRGYVLLSLILCSIFKNPATLKQIGKSFLYTNRAIRDLIRAELLFIAIKPVYRLQGVATKLVNHALAELGKKGVSLVKVSSDQSNTEANKLLQKLNFEFKGFSRFYGKKVCLYNKKLDIKTNEVF